MRIGEIIGSVTLSRAHPSIQGASWKLVVPFDQAALRGDDAGRGEPLVAFDELGAGLGSIIALSEGAEAAAPFNPEQKPLDAYNAALLENIELVDEDS
ncbi:Ethanolamine utilization protein EutN/carboxysome [Maioricimonas rarisocia]|uniref:Ethanolamine utilization protein EutN/carboxysome n=1 Tax=Maioricimonas rarisocia TaxID=2528026 RepID=A0A517ZAA5_9PLAN|nr:EutN/CcmL family microcompartment protein [Maioricimonas rarisocia]QDU39415.1 Ethanolamine utilization protein EutN/carboxysome [Maioricimonas rarisocia]